MTSVVEGGPAGPVSTNPFSRMAGAIIAPVDTFRAISQRPDYLVVLVTVLILAAVSSAIVSSHLDLETSLRAQFEKQGLKEEQADRAIAITEKLQKFSPVIALVTSTLFLLLIAGVPFIGFKVFGTDGSFKQFFSVANYAMLPKTIQSIIVTGLVAFKGKISAQEFATVLKSNPGSLVNMEDDPVGFAALTSIDFFDIWAVVLLIIGFAFAARVSRGRAAAVVITLWILFTFGRIGLAALQTLGGAS